MTDKDRIKELEEKLKITIEALELLAAPRKVNLDRCVIARQTLRKIGK